MRIAICLHGKIGGLAGKNGIGGGEDILLSLGYYNFVKRIIYPNKDCKIDFFLHCWDTKYEEDLKRIYDPKGILVEVPKKYKIPAFIKGTPKSESEKKAKELLEFLGLSHRINHKPNELSGGEQQRVAVARALINNPKIIFADEPSGNLDSESAETLHNLFFKLRDQFGQTFVIVTHNQELANMADRKLVMVDGKIVNNT